MPKINKQTIWYCHHYAGSPQRGMSFRPFYLTREFRALGFNAYMIGASFHHLLQKPFENQKEDVELHSCEGVPWITLKAKAYQGSGVGRLINSLQYARGFKRSLKALVQITGKPDVIIVSSGHPFHYSSLKKIADAFDAKLIFEVRDLWPLSLQLLLGYSSYHPMCLWMQHIESKAYRESNYVVSLLDNALSYMEQRGVSKKRYRVISNGTAMDATQTSKRLNQSLQNHIHQLRQTGHFLIGYAGGMGKPNALSHLVQAMSILQDKNLPIHFIAVGDGPEKEGLKVLASQLHLNNISFLDPIKRLEVTRFLKEMDGLYLGWHKSSLYEYGVSPNKLYDYMLAEKPVLESGGSPNALIERMGCGLRCEAESASAIAEMIEKVYTLSPQARAEMGQNGKNAVLSQFDYKQLAKSYQALFG